MYRFWPALLVSTMFLTTCSYAFALIGSNRVTRSAHVDQNGVLRWRDDGSEVALFGVNYYVPFSIDYASLKKLGVDHQLAIRQDVVHFARMGLDAIRLHVFDREISDEQGNLLDNEHLRLLDYLINECKQRGIYTVLTPIAWWPSPEDTRGFSDLYTKAQLYTQPAAIEAQRNYLRQFVIHKNRYTGLTYADDPAVSVFEIINEPIPSPGTSDDVIVRYIDTMCDAIRETGCEKPIFFNGWGGRLEAVGRSKADGCTFGWYPTGLAAGHMLKTDFLGRVDDYPSMRTPELSGKARIVYEFDAADVPGSYMYPAMARAFRSGGAQIATQFQYDPLVAASSNADWHTHYLNLVYTPKKAVSFIIAGEAFHRLPRLKTYGKHPESDRFSEFRVSYEEQLSEMVTDEAFMYSNDTHTRPPAAGRLRRIVGCGSSPLVEYEGTGAYFLDRIADGVWRLEVYPDAVWVADPFGPSSLSREVARVYWRSRAMTLHLPDLGADFAVSKPGNPQTGATARRGGFTVEPGVYVLRRRDAQEPKTAVSDEFVAPPPRNLPPTVWHVPAESVLEGQTLAIKATVAAARIPAEVVLHTRSDDRDVPRKIAFQRAGPYEFTATIPGEVIKRRVLTYCISVRMGNRELLFPQPEAGSVAKRFTRREPMTLVNFGADDTPPEVRLGGAPGETAKSAIVRGSRAGNFALRLTTTGFGPPPSAVGVRLPVEEAGAASAAYNTLRIRTRRTAERTTQLEVGLVEAGGAAYGYNVPLWPIFTDFRVSLSKLKPLWGTRGTKPHPERLREVSLVFGSWLFPDAARESHGLEVEEIALEYEPPAWTVRVVGPTDPILLFQPQVTRPGVRSDVPYVQSVVAGSRPTALAWRLGVQGFGQPPNCTSVRIDLTDLIWRRRSVISSYDTLHIRVRAGEPTTTAIEIVLSEADGTPWGATPKISTEWRDVRIPLTELRHFAHWHQTPEGRGGEGDHCRVENLATLHVTFGAWLYPDTVDQPHSFEIEFVRLEHGKG